MVDLYRHKKRGGKYRVIGNVSVQCEPASDIRDGDELVLYQGEDGRYWVRAPTEFFDGRFEPIPE